MWLAYVGLFVTGYALSLVVATQRWIVLCGIGVVIFGTIAILQAGFPERLTVLNLVARPDYQGPIVAALSICVFVVAIPLFNRVSLGERMGRLVVTLSEATFGVFLVHLAALLVPYRLFDGYRNHTSIFQAIAAYALILVVSFAISGGARRIPGVELVF